MPVAHPMTPFYRFATHGTIIPFLRMVSRRTVSGLENIPHEGGFIAVANHLTDLDLLTAMRALVDANVPVYSLAKSTLFKVPVLGSILRADGQILVQWGTQNTATALKTVSEVLADGGAIMILPEDTLSRDPLGWPMVAKTGAARLAMTSGAPVLFMRQWKAHEILDTCGRSFRPFPRKNVRVTVDELMSLSRFRQNTQDREAVRACIAEIIRATTALVEELRGKKAPRPLDVHYDNDPSKGEINVRRPDPLPETDAQEEGQ